MSGSFSRPYELRFRSKSTRTNFRAFLRDLWIKFWKLGFFIEKKLTFRFFRFLGKTFTFLIWFKQGRKNLQVKKMSRKKKCFKKKFFWQTDRIMYFSTHPGTLKTVHGNPLNFLSKTTCSQGGGSRIFRLKKVSTFKSRLTGYPGMRASIAKYHPSSSV